MDPQTAIIAITLGLAGSGLVSWMIVLGQHLIRRPVS